MKLYNIIIDGNIHLAADAGSGIVDVTAAGFSGRMEELISGGSLSAVRALAEDASLPRVEAPVFANIVNTPVKLLCVGLNYRAHAAGVNMNEPKQPILFSKFNDALAPAGAAVELPAWENSYDYEAELVIVMGKSTWNVSEEEAMDHVFGYSCGNDFSCRDAQMRSGQWLIGKTMPGFGPCGPCIVTKDSISPEKGVSVRSYVNGELRQDGSTKDMIFSCARIISYASKYVKLEPGDLIYTGTPSGVALEERQDKRRWLEKGDVVDVVIEGIGTLQNKMI